MKLLAAILAVLLPVAGIWLEGRTVAGYALLTAGFPQAAVRFFDDPAWRGAALYAAGRWQEAAEAFGPGATNAYNRGNALAHAGRYADALEAYDAAISVDPDNADAVYNRTLVARLVAEAPSPPDPVSAGMANSVADERRQGSKQPSAEGEASGVGTGFAGRREGASSRGPRGDSKVGQLGNGEQTSSDSGPGQASGSASDAEGAGRTGGMMVDVVGMIQARNRRAARMLEVRSVEPTEQWLMTLPDDPGQFLKLQILAEQARRKAHPASRQDDD